MRGVPFLLRLTHDAGAQDSQEHDVKGLGEIRRLNRTLLVAAAFAVPFILSSMIVRAKLLDELLQLLSILMISGAVLHAVRITNGHANARRVATFAVLLMLLAQVFSLCDAIPALSHVPILGGESALNRPLARLSQIAGILLLLYGFCLAVVQAGLAQRVLAEERMGLAAEVAERIQAEKELRDTKALLVAAIEQTPAGILIAEAPDVRISVANSAALGIRNDNSVALTEIPAELHPENWQTYRPDGTPFPAEELPLSQAVLQGKTLRNVEVIIRRPDGEERWVLANAAPVRDTEGTIVAGVVVFPDITESKRAEGELRQLATAIEQAAEDIVITDVKGVIQYCNPAFERITGYSRDEAIGQTPRLVKSGEHSPEFYAELWNTISQGRIWQGHFINRRKDGTLINEQATISPILDASGKVTGYVALKRDVTEELKLEEQFRQAQKMQAIGVLAGGIAHDFNNILSAILGYTELALDQVSAESKAHRDLRQVAKAGIRARDLIQQILTFSRQSSTEKKPIHLTSLVKEVLKLLRGTLPASIEIQQDLDADDDAVLADPAQLHQVLVNLCTNAFHAMEVHGGTLTVSIRRVELTLDDVRADLRLPPGPYLVLTVADTGEGMDEATRLRIFEPYFTTKREMKGTGLGLAVVHGIINSHQGAVQATSQPNQGSRFDVYLPALREGDRAGYRETPRLKNFQSGHGERVLLVEDQASVREVHRRILRRAGYTATVYADPAAALDILRSNPQAFDVVVSDQTMPGMSGIELAQVLRDIRPDLPVVLITGANTDAFRERAKAAGVRATVSKPARAEELSAALHHALHPSET